MLAPKPASLWALSSSPTNHVGEHFSLETIMAKGLSQPIFLTHSSDGSERLFVVEQNGRIVILEKGKLLPSPFMDISPLLATGGERGLLGLAFHPNYQKTGRYFLNYTRKQDGATVIAEFQVSSNPHRSEMRETVLLVIPQPYGNHNGGMVAFGPGGYLFIGTGDGGSGGDPGNRGQNPSELLGKILRIDVDHGSPYAIPATNPFSNEGGRPEIFALGFRNPWRFSFDRKTGELWTGDVGQNSWEEINVVKLGENHGWRLMEGNHCYKPDKGCRQSSKVTMPLTEYANAGPRCSVIGGYVYRGRDVPSLYGTYLFADYCSGEIFGFREGKQQVLLDTDLQITSFGEDEKGEVYVINHQGSIHRIINSPDSKP
jgi:glucose/arabinose dehydrogenase